MLPAFSFALRTLHPYGGCGGAPDRANSAGSGAGGPCRVCAGSRPSDMKRGLSCAMRRSLVSTGLALLGAAAATLPACAADARSCPDLLVDAADLDQIFDRSLGDLRALVDQRAVAIDPASPACYVRFELTSSALAQLGGACRLDGCSSVIFRERSLALRDFDVRGCDALFDGLGLSRRVPAVYADATRRIRQHCGSDGFEIERVTPVRADGEARLRIAFRAASAAR